MCETVVLEGVREGAESSVLVVPAMFRLYAMNLDDWLWRFVRERQIRVSQQFYGLLPHLAHYIRKLLLLAGPLGFTALPSREFTPPPTSGSTTMPILRHGPPASGRARQRRMSGGLPAAA
jgi:hypothetical protein